LLVAKLLNRFGRRLATLSALEITYPVGRAGTRFEALLSTGALYGLDTAKLGFFVVEDHDGTQYPAMIDSVTVVSEEQQTTLIRGVVVAHG
jgi:hypothetical protein